ncbi:MAG: UDP-2,4-diacetamido-2,4,6-trideoxy-beta-L-altropyranose hydrolase [Oscillospiraceae bacterium]|nr:UDP-2,4-diacetamido-2,4,6-trideoxy-beta-L-altropyranose hydrolase [Oscillospiraceae bacterium]
MRIAFRAEGSAEIGIGHLTRCSAIAIECVKKGFDVCFFARNDSELWLREKRMPLQILPKCNTIQKETSEFISLANRWAADYAFVDSYELTQQCYNEIFRNLPTITIDDFAHFPYTATTLINANVFADLLNYSDYNVKKLLLGGKYIILRDEFVEASPAPFNQRVSRILVTMGGADINNCTPFVLEALCKIRNIQVVVIVGPMFRGVLDIETAASKCKSEVQILYTPNNLAEVFSSCDIAISAASTTTYELCSLGVPTILIQQAANQQMICDYFMHSDSLFVLGEFKSISKQLIEHAVLSLINNENKRFHMRESVLALVSRNGVNNIVKEAFC